MRSVSFCVLMIGALACQGALGKPPSTRQPKPTTVVDDAADDPTTEQYKMPALPTVRVTLTDAYGGKHEVIAEVCADRKSRTRGLMWRTQLDDGKGMIFLFPREQRLQFWMRNTLIPLDMIFITKEFKIAGVVENAEPRTETGRAVARPSQFVLEVPAGWAKKHELQTGGLVKIEGTAGILVSED